MPVGGGMDRGRTRLAFWLLVAIALGGCSNDDGNLGFDPAGLGKDKQAMVAVGKAAGVIARRLPANCTRVYVGVDRRWGTIDAPAWNRDDKRCTPYSRQHPRLPPLACPLDAGDG